MQTACLDASSGGATTEKGSKLLIGWASTDITPEKPAALAGQFFVRISKQALDPITATALAIESAGEDNASEQVIMVSCDLLWIPDDSRLAIGFGDNRQAVQGRLRDIVKPMLPDFDTGKLFLNATHTHTAPIMAGGWCLEQSEEVMTPSEYVDFLLSRLSEAVVEAWNGRKHGGASWALSHAVVGHNRRAVYIDGSAKMYGSTDTADFSHVEGYEDHSLNLLFFWNEEGEPTGIVVNVACPAQASESVHQVSADFWHEARAELRKRYSESLFVLPQCSAAGDQAPRFLLSGRAEENMRKRKAVSEREEIAVRIADAVDYVFPAAKSDIRTAARLDHAVEELKLPVRKVTKDELECAKSEYNRLLEQGQFDKGGNFVALGRNKSLIDRHERQRKDPFYRMELHVVRFGDIAIATNPFELFVEYGIRIKAQSKALQTFVIQLACSAGGYLPTAKAVAGGGYSAEVADIRVGPEGGQVLVDRTVELINGMWDDEND